MLFIGYFFYEPADVLESLCAWRVVKTYFKIFTTRKKNSEKNDSDSNEFDVYFWKTVQLNQLLHDWTLVYDEIEMLLNIGMQYGWPWLNAAHKREPNSSRCNIIKKNIIQQKFLFEEQIPIHVAEDDVVAYKNYVVCL